MGIKAIDSEGLMNRTRRYEQSNVFEMFSDIRKINKACIKADQALAESGLGEFSSLGYEDLSGKITKIQNDLSLLEQVPGFIISEFIDQDDTDFALLMSNEVLAELNKLHMDEISLNGKNLSDMQSLKDKTANKDESKMVISERDLADMIILYETNLDVLNSNEKEKYNLCFSLMLARSNTQIPYTQNEVKSLLTGCTRTEKEGIIRTICKDYETVFGTNPKEWSEKSKQFLVDYSRHLLPEKMSDVENIDTTQLVAFNNAIFVDSNYVEGFLNILSEGCKNKEDILEFKQLGRIWKTEADEWNSDTHLLDAENIIHRYNVSKINVELGRGVSIKGTKHYIHRERGLKNLSSTLSISDWDKKFEHVISEDKKYINYEGESYRIVTSLYNTPKPDGFCLMAETNMLEYYQFIEAQGACLVAGPKELNKIIIDAGYFDLIDATNGCLNGTQSSDDMAGNLVDMKTGRTDIGGQNSSDCSGETGVFTALDTGKMLSDFVSSGRKDLRVTVTFYEAANGEKIATMGLNYSDMDYIYDTYAGSSMSYQERVRENDGATQSFYSNSAKKLYIARTGKETDGSTYDVVICLNNDHRYEDYHALMIFDENGNLMIERNIMKGDKFQIVKGDDQIIYEAPLPSRGYVSANVSEKIMKGLSEGLEQ